jgi:hypothetical protein
MDAVLGVTVTATIIFGALSVWALYIRRRDRRRKYVDMSFVIMFASLWVILVLLLLGVPWLVAYPLVFFAVVAWSRLRRRSWKRLLDQYKK